MSVMIPQGLSSDGRHDALLLSKVPTAQVLVSGGPLSEIPPAVRYEAGPGSGRYRQNSLRSPDRYRYPNFSRIPGRYWRYPVLIPVTEVPGTGRYRRWKDGRNRKEHDTQVTRNVSGSTIQRLDCTHLAPFPDADRSTFTIGNVRVLIRKWSPQASSPAIHGAGFETTPAICLPSSVGHRYCISDSTRKIPPVGGQLAMLARPALIADKRAISPAARLIILAVLAATAFIGEAAVLQSVSTQAGLNSALANTAVTDISVTASFTLTGSQISITRSVNIYGSCGASNCVISTDGVGPNRVFDIATSDLAVTIGGGLTFTAPQRSQDGGAISCTGTGTTLLLQNVVFDQVYSDRGALFVSGCDTRCFYCSFTNNVATTHGGAVFLTTSSFYCYECLFTGNTASDGGAINVFSAGTGDLDYCSFSGNVASARGNDVNMQTGPSTLTYCPATPVPGACVEILQTRSQNVAETGSRTGHRGHKGRVLTFQRKVLPGLLVCPCSGCDILHQEADRFNHMRKATSATISSSTAVSATSP
eukprot:jgi/Mesvir1/7804/Mv11746-RA.1